jgi:hypothetical protein
VLRGLTDAAQNNANEGVTFVPLFAFTTNEQSEKYIREYYRLFTPNDFERLFKLYPSFGDTDPHQYNFATSGVKAPTALEISTWSNGEQQRVAVSTRLAPQGPGRLD